MEAIKGYSQDIHTIEEINPVHQELAMDLKKIIVDNVDLDQYQDEALGKKFERVLEDTGVFIMDTPAREGFNRFIAYVNNK